MSTDPKTVTEIEYTLNPENLWVGDPEREGIDAEASARRYAEMLTSCFEELYPQAAVKIMIDETSLGCHVETDGSKTEAVSASHTSCRCPRVRLLNGCFPHEADGGGPLVPLLLADPSHRRDGTPATGALGGPPRWARFARPSVGHPRSFGRVAFMLDQLPATPQRRDKRAEHDICQDPGGFRGVGICDQHDGDDQLDGVERERDRKKPRRGGAPPGYRHMRRTVDQRHTAPAIAPAKPRFLPGTSAQSEMHIASISAMNPDRATAALDGGADGPRITS